MILTKTIAICWFKDMTKKGVAKMYVNADKCEEFDLDYKKIQSIARRISNAAKEAQEMGLCIFGGSGSGSLRYGHANLHGPGHNIVADLDGRFDGGDGGDVY